MGVQFSELVTWVRNRKIFASVLLALTLGIGIMIGTLIPGHVAATRSASAGATGVAMIAIPDPVNLSNSFSTIVGHVEPAVVKLSTTQVFDAPKGTPGKRGQDSFQDFFNKFFKQEPGAQGPESETSLGSGVIVDKKGYILTNDHVIDGATKIQVTVDGDSAKYTGRIIGVDKQTDLAVIKIESDHPLPTARLGNSDGVKVGDWVLAFGSPFSLSGTVTAGIVSAKNRTNIGQSQFQDFIQTDAAINPGNSGGPLVNLAGEVIGIDTAIYTGSRGFEGVGFALPSNSAIGVYNQIVTTGRVVRGSIGIRFQEEQIHDALLHKQLGAPYGVVVEYVTPGGPAAKAGIQAGDVITEINTHPIHAGADLINPVVATPIGRSVELTFMHNRKSANAVVAVADMSKVFPDDPGNAQPVSGGVDPAPASFGLHVEALTPEALQHLRMSVTQTGVIVTGVDPASFAEDIQFAQFDIIVELNHAPIANMQDYKREIAKLKPGEDVLFKVIHPDGTGQQYTMFHAGTIPQAGN